MSKVPISVLAATGEHLLGGGVVDTRAIGPSLPPSIDLAILSAVLVKGREGAERPDFS